MADEDNGTQVNEVEQKARVMGWRPQEEYKGTAPWVDAETFVKRGEEVLPIVNATNKRLRETVDSQNARLLELERLNKANAAALEELVASNREVRAERAEQTVEQIEAQIIQAREAGDMQTELTLLRQHATAVTAAAKAKEKPAPQNTNQSTNGGDMTQTAAFQQFLQQNPWFNTDPVMRAASIEIQNELVRNGKISAATSQSDRLEMVAEATRQRFGMKDNGRRGDNRVEGGGGPGAGTQHGTTGKSYADLPADAKEACAKAAKRLKIGEGQKYKTVADWQAEYARIYYS